VVYVPLLYFAMEHLDDHSRTLEQCLGVHRTVDAGNCDRSIIGTVRLCRQGQLRTLDCGRLATNEHVQM
jgi:hypothetical protein